MFYTQKGSGGNVLNIKIVVVFQKFGTGRNAEILQILIKINKVSYFKAGE